MSEHVAADGRTFQLRRLSSHQEFDACVALQRKVWGDDFSGCVPASILMIAEKMGGIVLGAFDGEGRLAGFVYGLIGVREGESFLWSDILAVRADVRDAGLGGALKLRQRELAIESGLDMMRWSFDPLESRNAHLNLNRLGVYVEEYAEDYYAEDDSALGRGLGTDRFLVAWDLELAPPDPAKAGLVFPDLEETPLIRSKDDRLPLEETVLIEIPSDIQQLRSRSSERAWEWRLATRRTFCFYLARCYAVVGFRVDRERGRSFYAVWRPPRRLS